MSTQPIKQLEIETYYHKGIGVTVKIDYVNGKISLLDHTNNPKKWVFAERSIEYMAGWQDILDGMKLAVDQAEAKLEKHQEAKMREFVRKERDFQRELKKEGKKMGA